MWYRFCSCYSLVYSDYNGVLSRVHDKQLTKTGKTIFHSDCEKCSKLLIPLFISKSTRDLNLFYLYAIYNAKYKNPNIVKTCIAEGKKVHLLTKSQVLILKITSAYGNIRPYIRRVYHKLFNKVKIIGE